MIDGPTISLVPPDPHFYPYLFELLTSDENSWAWRHRGQSPEWSDFQRGLSSGVLTSWVVLRASDNVAAGFSCLYDFDPRSGCVRYSLALEEGKLGVVGAFEVGLVSLRYACNHWPIRKVYAHRAHHSRNAGVAELPAPGFNVEGVLRDAVYFDGAYIDETISAMTADEVRRRYSQLATRRST